MNLIIKKKFLHVRLSLFLLPFLFFLPACGGGNDGISQDGSPNVKISIAIPESGNSGSSNLANKYNHIPITTVELTVTFSGYSTVSTDVISASGGTVTLQYTLEPGSYTFTADAYNGVVDPANLVYQGAATAAISSTLTSIAIPMISTAPEQRAVDGANSTFAAFKNLVNTKGAAATATDFLPFHHTNYMDSGRTAAMSAADMKESTSWSINSLYVDTVVAFDPQAPDYIEVNGLYAGIEDGIPVTELLESEAFQYDAVSDKWLLYGNQEIVAMNIAFGMHRYVSVFGNETTSIEGDAWFAAPQGTVTSVELQGPVYSSTSNFFYSTGCAQESHGGYLYDTFHNYCNSIDLTPTRTPTVNDPFTVIVTKADSSTVTYTRYLTDVFLSDAPSITSPTGHTLADANLGATLSVSWSLPGIAQTPYADDIHLKGQACAVEACSNIDGTVTSTTSGAISLPAFLNSVPVDNAYIYVSWEPDEVGIRMSTSYEFRDIVVSSISAASNPTSIAADGTSTSTISAYVYDQYSYPVADGTVVTFTTTAGTLSASSETTVGGVTTVTLTSAATPGTATITATSGGISGTATVDFTLF